MFSKITIIFFFVLFGYSASHAQSVWMVGDNPCNVNNYFQELWKGISESKYGLQLKYAKSVSEIKEVKVGDIIIIFTCAIDSSVADGKALAVGRSFTKIDLLANTTAALNMLQSSATLVYPQKLLETLRQNYSDIMSLLNMYYVLEQPKQDVPHFTEPKP